MSISFFVFACSREKLTPYEFPKAYRYIFERSSEVIKVNINDTTFEFRIIRNVNGSVTVSRNMIEYDATAPSSGVFVDSNSIIQTSDTSFKLIENYTYIYVPFRKGLPSEIILNAAGSTGEYYCECEKPSEITGNWMCELEFSGPGPWKRWRCDGDCADCDLRWCPLAMPGLDPSTDKLYGIIIRASSVCLFEGEDFFYSIGIYYGGNCRIEIQSPASGTVIAKRSLVSQSFPLELYNYSDVASVSNTLYLRPGQNYWIIPFDMDLGYYQIGGDNTPRCISDDCRGECSMKTNSKGCLECVCDVNGDCDMLSVTMGVIVAGASISVSNL